MHNEFIICVLFVFKLSITGCIGHVMQGLLDKIPKKNYKVNLASFFFYSELNLSFVSIQIQSNQTVSFFLNYNLPQVGKIRYSMFALKEIIDGFGSLFLGGFLLCVQGVSNSSFP